MPHYTLAGLKIKDIFIENPISLLKINPMTRNAIDYITHISSIIFIVTTVFVLYSVIPTKHIQHYINKDEIHNQIILAIKNGASLDDIKQIHLNAKKEKNLKSTTWLNSFAAKSINEDSTGYYKEDIALINVLKDTKSELFLREQADVELIKSISKKIDEYNQSNPFDKLESGQRISFDTIKEKLGDNYFIIQEDINRIVDEVDRKNQLTNKYLSDSTMSYKLSIYAFIIGIITLFPLAKSLWIWSISKIKHKD